MFLDVHSLKIYLPGILFQDTTTGEIQETETGGTQATGNPIQREEISRTRVKGNPRTRHYKRWEKKQARLEQVGRLRKQTFQNENDIFMVIDYTELLLHIWERI